MQIARIPSPSDCDEDRIVVIAFGVMKPEMGPLLIISYVSLLRLEGSRFIQRLTS